MIDKRLEARIREGKLSRRDFLKLGLGGAAYLLYACKHNPITPDTDIPVSYTGSMRYLIGDTSVNSGKLIFNGTTEVPISGGTYTITNSHNLTAGDYNVRVESDAGYPRETKAHLSNRGLYVVRSNLPLDNVIEKNAIYINEYNNWLTNQGSERWLSNKPKFFLYDKSLWTFDGSKLVVKDSNYNMNPTTIAGVEYVVNNHIHLYTDNFVSGQLYKESTSSERPDPNSEARGWIIYLDQDNAMYSITQSDDDSQGDIYSGMMRFQPGSHKIWGISIDTAQTLGIGQQHNSGQILTGTEPSDLAKKVAKIIYNRAPRHSMFDGVDRE